MEGVYNFALSFRYLFYGVHPAEQDLDDVNGIESYGKHALPAISVVIALEILLKQIFGQGSRLNDVISSTSQGFLYELSRIWTFGVEIVIYMWIYDRFHLVTISPYSWTNWVICAVTVDLGYYWIHRLSHEVQLFWAIHQVHHSSEEYNMTTAIRLPVLRPFLEWLTCLPMALVVPPAMFLVHYELQLLLQAWIHFGMIGKLGYLDYVINTPSNHRVHHGRNRRCIDRNFGGILMVWDHLFGTYASEGDQKIAFGLTHPLQTFDPVHVQFHVFFHMWRRLLEVQGWRNKLSVLFKGPGWDVGKPRLGYLDEIPEEPDEKKFDPPISRGLYAYIIVHFILVLKMFMDVVEGQKKSESTRTVFGALFVTFTTVPFAYLLENRSAGKWLETLRCALYLLIEAWLPHDCTGFLQDAGLAAILSDLERTVFLVSLLHNLLQLGMESSFRSHIKKITDAMK